MNTDRAIILNAYFFKQLESVKPTSIKDAYHYAPQLEILVSLRINDFQNLSKIYIFSCNVLLLRDI